MRNGAHSNTYRSLWIAVSATAIVARATAAATVSWQPAFEFVDTSSLRLAGQTVVYAQDGDNGFNPNPAATSVTSYSYISPASTKSVTIGNVVIPFEGVSIKYGNGTAFPSWSNGDLLDHLAGQSGTTPNVTFAVTLQNTSNIPLGGFDRALANDPANARIYPVNTGNSALDSVLSTGIYIDGKKTGTAPSELNIVLNHLAAGKNYQVQLIALADARGLSTPPKVPPVSTVSDATISNNVASFTGDADLSPTDGVSHVTSVVGTFVADSSGSQPVNINLVSGKNPGISAIIVTHTPDTLRWDNTSASGNGSSWDSALNQNWRSSNPTTFINGDNVTFDDANNGNYNVALNSTLSPSSIIVNNTSGNYAISGSGGIAGTSGLIKNGGATLKLSTTNTYTGNTTVNAGELTLGAAGSLSPNTNLKIADGAVVNTDPNANAKLILTVNSVTTTGNGYFDLSGNDLIVHGAGATPGTTLATVTSLVTSGFNGGYWNGPGLNSCTAGGDARYLTALGVATGLTSIDGAATSTSDVVVKYTYYGDTNLDGVVHGTDYSNIYLAYASGNAVANWQNGDFNYDGKIDGSDYTLIDNAFNLQGTSEPTEMQNVRTSAASQIAATVPEPGSLGMLTTAAIALLGKRRRNRK